MNLRFPESEINYWSNRYTERQRERNRIIEQELIDLKPEVQNRGYLTQEELHKIAQTLEITQTRSSYFGEYRRLHNRDHRNSIHSHR